MGHTVLIFYQGFKVAGGSTSIHRELTHPDLIPIVHMHKQTPEDMSIDSLMIH